eukprot:jgi/Botrbrau1/2668/Bobra.0203s0015.1
MGQAISSGLTQNDVEELIAHTGGRLNQAEIEGLYNRFRTLDKGMKGYISSDEINSIPELSINPLQKRLQYMFEDMNFKEFVRVLAPFSKRATKEDRVAFIFRIYDVDGDGIVSADDLELMVRMLAGKSLSEELVKAIVTKALSEASNPARGLLLDDFRTALQNSKLDCQVEFPMAW